MANIGQELSSINFGSILGGSLNAIVEAQSLSAHTTVDFIRSVGFQTEKDGALGEPVYVRFRYPKEISPYQAPQPARCEVKVLRSGKGYSPEIPLKLTADKAELNCTLQYTAEGGISSVTLNETPTVSATTTVAISAAGTLPDGVKLPEGASAAQLQLVYTAPLPAQAAAYQDMSLEVPILTMMPIPFIRIDDATIDFNVKINSVTSTGSSSASSYGGSVESYASYNGWRFKAGVKLNATLSNQKKSENSEEIKRDYSLSIHVHAVQDDMPGGVARLLDILEEATIAREV